jgi:hypothetical protein
VGVSHGPGMFMRRSALIDMSPRVCGLVSRVGVLVYWSRGVGVLVYMPGYISRGIYVWCGCHCQCAVLVIGRDVIIMYGTCMMLCVILRCFAISTLCICACLSSLSALSVAPLVIKCCFVSFNSGGGRCFYG